jgi:hypothetical protein
MVKVGWEGLEVERPSAAVPGATRGKEGIFLTASTPLRAWLRKRSYGKRSTGEGDPRKGSGKGIRRKRSGERDTGKVYGEGIPDRDTEKEVWGKRSGGDTEKEIRERNTRKKHEKRDAVRGQRKSNGGDKRASHRGEQAKGYRDSKIGALQAIAISE